MVVEWVKERSDDPQRASDGYRFALPILQTLLSRNRRMG